MIILELKKVVYVYIAHSLLHNFLCMVCLNSQEMKSKKVKYNNQNKTVIKGFSICKVVCIMAWHCLSLPFLNYYSYHLPLLFISPLWLQGHVLPLRIRVKLYSIQKEKYIMMFDINAYNVKVNRKKSFPEIFSNFTRSICFTALCNIVKTHYWQNKNVNSIFKILLMVMLCLFIGVYYLRD